MPRLRNKIFLSYNRNDKEYAERFYRQLIGRGALMRQIFWDRAPNAGMEPGEDWRMRIDAEIREARVALFFISEHFHIGTFGRDYELPALVREAKSDPRLKLHYVCLRTIPPPRELGRDIHSRSYDAALETLPENERDTLIDRVAGDLISGLGADAGVHDDFLDRVKMFARRDLGCRIDSELCKGRSSVIYIAEGQGERRLIKAQLANVFGEHSSLDEKVLQSHLDLAGHLQDPTFIPFHGGAVRDDLRLLVSDYLSDARSLRAELDELEEKDERLQIWRVRQAIRSLASALSEYHKNGLAYGNLRPSDVMVQGSSNEDWRVRLPALRMSRVARMIKTRKMTISMDPEVLTALAPEQHSVLSVTQKSDQYSLGLLGIELLQNKPAVEVAVLDDLKKKESFFDDPAAFGDWAGRSPRLRPVLLKLLARDPRKRFNSMADVVASLTALESADEDDRRIAKESYRNLHKSGVWDALIQTFYNYLIQHRKDWETAFQSLLARDGHFDKLDQAVTYLMHFREEDRAYEPTTLTRLRKMHGPMNLTSRDYVDFGIGLLVTLREFGETSEETQSAWITTISPGLAYMAGDDVDRAAIEKQLLSRKRPSRRKA